MSSMPPHVRDVRLFLEGRLRDLAGDLRKRMQRPPKTCGSKKRPRHAI